MNRHDREHRTDAVEQEPLIKEKFIGFGRGFKDMSPALQRSGKHHFGRSFATVIIPCS